MEKQKKKNRVSEFIIVVLVIACAFLIIADMTTNLIEELDTQESQITVNDRAIGTATPRVRPTYPPNYTPPPVNEAGS